MHFRARRMTCSLPSTALSQLATMAENVRESQAAWSWVTVMRSLCGVVGGDGRSPGDVVGPVAGAVAAQPHRDRAVPVVDDDAGGAPAVGVAAAGRVQRDGGRDVAATGEHRDGPATAADREVADV